MQLNETFEFTHNVRALYDYSFNECDEELIEEIITYIDRMKKYGLNEDIRFMALNLPLVRDLLGLTKSTGVGKRIEISKELFQSLRDEVYSISNKNANYPSKDFLKFSSKITFDYNQYYSKETLSNFDLSNEVIIKILNRIPYIVETTLFNTFNSIFIDEISKLDSVNYNNKTSQVFSSFIIKDETDGVSYNGLHYVHDQFMSSLFFTSKKIIKEYYQYINIDEGQELLYQLFDFDHVFFFLEAINNKLCIPLGEFISFYQKGDAFKEIDKKHAQHLSLLEKTSLIKDFLYTEIFNSYFIDFIIKRSDGRYLQIEGKRFLNDGMGEHFINKIIIPIVLKNEPFLIFTTHNGKMHFNGKNANIELRGLGFEDNYFYDLSTEELNRFFFNISEYNKSQKFVFKKFGSCLRKINRNLQLCS